MKTKILRKSTHIVCLLTILFVVFLFDNNTYSANRTFTGPGNFSDATKWSLSTLPSAGDNLQINGTCTFDDLANNLAYGTLNVGFTLVGTLNWPVGGTNTLNVSGISSTTAGSSIDMTNGGTLSIRGAWSNTNQSFTCGIGNVEFNSTASLNVLPRTYNNLTLSNTASYTAGNAVSQTITINGNLNVNSNFNMLTWNPVITVKGNFTYTAGNCNFSSSSTFSVGGDFNWNHATGIVTGFLNNNGTIEFNGTAAQSIAASVTPVSPLPFRNLKISNISAAVAVNTNINIAATLNMNGSGTLLTPAPAVVINTGGAAGTISGNGTIQVTRTSATADYLNQYKFSTNTLSSMTVDYAGTGDQSINSTVGNYGGLIISGSGTKTTAAGLTVLGNIKISAGTFSGGTSLTHNIGGNWTNNSYFIYTTGSTINFNGSSGQTLDGSAETTFNNLILFNSSGIMLGQNESINGTLTFSNGKISTGAYFITLPTGSSVSGAGAGKYINGNLSMGFDGTHLSNTFDIGDATNYTPVDLAFASIGTAGNILAYTTAGPHPNLGTSNISGIKYINRYWTLTNSSTVFTTYDATYHFVAGDILGGANTSSFIVGKYSSGWSYPVVSTLTSTSSKITGVDSFSDFAMGELGCTGLALSTCPSGTTVSADAGCTYTQSGTDLNAVFTGTCTPITFTYVLTGITTGSASGTGGVDLNGVTFNKGVTTVSWSAVDANSTSATCTFTVTVIDNTKPAITGCPSSQTVSTGPGNTACSQTASWSNGTATDNCTASTDLAWTYTQNPGTSFGVGITMVTVTVRDAALNSSTCTFGITVVDNTVPTISCTSDKSVNTNNNQCTYTKVNTNWNATGGDNCSGWAITYSLSGASTGTGTTLAGAIFEKGITTVTWTNTDASSNVSSCSFTVTVTDIQPPTINCDADKSVNTDNNQCTYTKPGTAWDANGNDNCGDFVITYDLTGATTGTGTSLAGVPINKGITTVTWTNTDASSNSVTCSYTITVTDAQLPTINCITNKSVNTDNNACFYTKSGTNWDAGGSDNCPGWVITYSLSGANTGTGSSLAGVQFAKGITTVTWTNTDASSNVTTCSFTVTVTDIQPPTINCDADKSVNTDNNQCTYTKPGTAWDAGGNDNCPGFVITYSLSGATTGTGTSLAGVPINKGITTVTWTNTDASSNSVTCSYTITVTDAQLPTINCITNKSVNTDNNACFYTKSGTNWDASGNDNCPGWVITYSLSGANTGTGTSLAGVQFAKGITTVTWTNTDASSNIKTCSFTVTVNDAQLPSINCGIDKSVNTDNNQCTYTRPGTGWDAGGNDNCPGWIITYSLSGATTGSGNSLAGVPINKGITTVTWTNTDASSNINTCSYTITVTDVQPPTLNCDADKSVNTDDGVCTFTKPGTAWDANGNDNCTGFVITYEMTGATTGTGTSLAGVPINKGITTVTWTNTDASSNVTTCSYMVTVTDLQGPVISNCPSDMTVNTQDYNPSSCSQIVSWNEPTAQDNCTAATDIQLVKTHSPGDIFTEGVHNVKYTFTDGDGNSTNCRFKISVVDNTPPVFNTCPAGQTICAGQGNSQATISGLDPVYQDNCSATSDIILTYTLQGATTGSGTGGVSSGNVMFNAGPTDLASGVTTITYQATDAAGNSSTCIVIVRVDKYYQATVAQSLYDLCNPGIAIFAGNAPGEGITSWAYTGYTALPQNPPPAPYVAPNTLQVGNNLFFWNPVNGYTYNFNYVVTNGTCISSTPVTLNDYPPAGPPNAGNPQTICEDATLTSFVLAAQTPTPGSATGSWTCLSAPSPLNPATDVIFSDVNVTNPTVSITGNAALIPGTYTMAWDVYNVACGPYYSNVQVTVVAKPVINNPGSVGSGPFCEGSSITVTGASVSNVPLVSWSSPNGHGFFSNVNDVNTSYTSGIGDAAEAQPIKLILTAFGNSPCSPVSSEIDVTITSNPTVVCPANITASCAVSSCDASISIPAPTFNPANTCIASYINNKTGTSNASGTYPKGVTTVKWTVTFLNGSTATCSHTITVVDDLAPAISNCPGDISVYSSTGNTTSCSQIASWTPVTATDNCTATSAIVVTKSNNPGDVFTLGNHVVTYTFKDLANNTSTCTFNVTVIDDTKPVISNCPSSQTVSTGVGRTSCDLEASWTEPGVSDNCNGVSMSSDYASGYAFPVGATTVTYTAWDPSNNQETCQFSITVIDNTDPVISGCPGDMSVYTAGRTSCDQVATWTDPTVFDNCPGYSMTSDHSSGDVFAVGNTSVTFHAWDAYGNTDDCSFTVYVFDNTDPVITSCPGDQTVYTDLGSTSCNQVATWTDPGVSDNCSAVTMVSDHNSGDAFDVGTTLVTFTATDQYTNSATCTFNVTVIDNTDPVISGCPSSQTVYTGVGHTSCDQVATWTDPTVFDNCPGYSMTSDHYSGDTYPEGITTVTFHAWDVHGLTADCSFTVTVVDNTDPVITDCPSSQTVYTGIDHTTCDQTATWAEPSITDNCPGVSWSSDYASGASFPVGTPTTVTYHAWDAHGNIADCSFDITVIDNTVPTIACPASSTVPADGSCQYTLGDYTGLATAWDNCGAPGNALAFDGIDDYVENNAMTIDPSLGFTIEGWMKVNDLTYSGLASQVVVNYPAPFDTYVVGTGDPDNAPGTVRFYLGQGVGPNLSHITTAATVTPGAWNHMAFVYDPGTTSMSIYLNGVLSATGPVVIPPANNGSSKFRIGGRDDMVTATNGTIDEVRIWNSVRTPAEIAANMNSTLPVLPPELKAYYKFDQGVANGSNPGVTTATDATGNYNGTLNNFALTGTSSNWVDGTVFLPNVTVTQSPAASTAIDKGLNTITLTATDVHGNSATCTFSLEVLDITDPAISNCPSSQTVYTGSGRTSCDMEATWTEPTASDNCPGFSMTADHASGDAFPVGTPTTVTYHAWDASGNTATDCSFTITVIDNTDPVITGCPSSQTISTFGLKSPVPQCGKIATWTAPTPSDNCPGVSMSSDHLSNDFFDVGTTTVTYHAWDAYGNTANCTFSITVVDNTPPVITGCPGDITVNTDAGRTSCDQNATWTAPTVSDNCPGVSMSSDYNSGDLFYLSGNPTTVTYHAWDAHGNTADCTFTVTVLDNTDPVITGCPSSQTVSTGPGRTSCDQVVSWTEPTVDDNCPGVSMSVSFSSGSLFPVGSTTVTYHAWDAHGNTANCTFDITVEDNTDPILSGCPSDMTLGTDTRTSCDQVATWVDPTYSDNCPGVSLSSDYASGSVFPVAGSPTTVTYTAYDAHGNFVTCQFNVTVQDNTPPVISNCPGNMTFNTGAGSTSCDAAVSWTAPTADDNCSTPTLTADMSPGTWIVGSYTVTYTAVDASTNSSTCSFTIDVIDNTPPTIGCPGDMTSCADDLQTYSTQLTGLGHASEGDNCGIATISYTLTGATSGSGTGDIADNSQFNNGITTVTYMATDIHGNSATCQFTVHVFALPTPTWATSLTRQFTTSPVYTLTGGLPSGGTYSGNGVIPNTNSFKGVISGAGTQTLYYMVVDANTCSATVTNTIDVWDSITGDVTVGAGGDFWTITGMNGLFYSMNLLTCTGDVTAKIVSDISEPGTYALTANYSPYNLNVVPVDANLRTMYGNYASLGLFRINGADNFTIDGNFGGSGRYLKWKNAHASAATFYLYNDARSNNIKNSIIKGNNTSGTTSGVIYLASTTGSQGNGLNLIDGNLIADTVGVPVNLIYSNGNNNARNSDNTINNNELMNFKSNGIYVTATGNGNNWMISLNNFYTSLTGANTSQAAINFIPGASSANNNILGNTMGGMAIFAGGSPWQNATTGAYSGATWVAGYVKGISVNVGTSPTTIIDGNVIQNFKLTGQALSANQPPATFTGVEVLGGMVTVSGSTIGHASSAGSITVDGVGSFFGINQGSTNAGCLLDNNLIANVSYTLNTGTPSITGVYLKNGTVQRTAIYSIGTTLTTLRPTITGLQNAGTGGAVIAYYNNMVSLNAGSAKQASMFGFLDNNNNKLNNVPNGGTCKFWHNSINIYGGTSDLSTNTYDVYRGSGITDNFDMEENILSNTRTAVTGVTHYTIFNAVVGSFTSNYNDFYFPNVAGNPVTGYLLGYYNGANRSNLTAWQTATAMDANSMVQDPKFVSGTNLHLQSSSPCINAGGPALILTTDFDGGPRTIPPDMGADEYGAKDHIVVPALQAGTFDASLTIYPNPFSQTTTLACSVNEESTITLNVYDIMGQQVGGNATHGVSTVPAGTTTFDFSANDLKPGIYFCRLTINSGTASKVIVKRMEIIR